jgi:hypothetical protein
VKKEIKILEYRTAFTGEKTKNGYPILTKIWFENGIGTNENIKELLEKYLSEGWKIEFASDEHCVLSREK